MSETLYLPRQLTFEGRTIPEREILSLSRFAVVLAEPGAGKTELLTNIAHQLSTHRNRASVFRHNSDTSQQDILIVDGLDEAAKVDDSAIDAIIVKISAKKPTCVILASRSSEWDEDRHKRFFMDCLGEELRTFRLHPFDDAEQKAFFEAILPDENFQAFQVEADKFELSNLTGNPQFLQLFAKAYVQNDRRFDSKNQIFGDAIRYLAEEHNKDVPKRNRANTDDIVRISEEVFAKLLLSGSSGVAFPESATNESYPSLLSISSAGNQQLLRILDTALFKIAEQPQLHEPVHRIVAEYCAARYLTKRISDAKDAFQLRRCMSIVAPNSTVREELRGLLGWMAALGNKEVQESAVVLDPYAVLANGDPALLLDSSKMLLLRKLGELSAEDPYFRRGDYHRNFSTIGFFTAGVIELVRQQLSEGRESTHLLGLLLEMLQGTPANSALESELEALLLNPSNSYYTRLLASRNLLDIGRRSHVAAFTALITERSQDSLTLASKLIVQLGVAYFGFPAFLDLLKSLADLYPSENERGSSVIGSRHFIKELIDTLALDEVICSLDALSTGLKCTCGPEHDFSCHCRHGSSKVIGKLLDRYFLLETGSRDAATIWKWVKGLNFPNSISAEQSQAVSYLRANHEFRQAIQLHALAGLADIDEIRKVQFSFVGGHSHGGLFFQPEDYRKLVDFAFESNALSLWESCLRYHNFYSKNHEVDSLRSHMRLQANSKPSFMRLWAERNRAMQMSRYEHRQKRYPFERRRKKKARKNKVANVAHLAANRTLIESGQHFGWLRLFADIYLMEPDRVLEFVDDPLLVESALRNCLPFLEKSLPSLARQAELSCQSQSSVSVHILHAACIAILRHAGSLPQIDPKFLAAVKADIDMHYQAVEDSERELLEFEINKQIFQTETDIEDFLKEYVEAQLSTGNCSNVRVDWLRSKNEFANLRGPLSIEWLNRFAAMPIHAVSTLFDLCWDWGDREKLYALTMRRCQECLSFDPGVAPVGEPSERRNFWFMRAFLTLEFVHASVWDHLTKSPDSIFHFEQIFGARHRGDSGAWATLNAEKTFMILDAFADSWPKVELPDSCGSHSPQSETAYRFLKDIVWGIGNDRPEASLPVVERILENSRLSEFHDAARNMRASAMRTQALQDFRAPSPKAIVELLDHSQIASVEDLRAHLLDELSRIQVWLKGTETKPLAVFYDGGRRVDENTARDRIVDLLERNLNAKNMSATIERYMADAKRCDFTVGLNIDGKQILLVVEVKGQWHSQLFDAAKSQLYERYAHHPNAAQQGIYLVLWFGSNEKIAGRKNETIKTPSDLVQAIVSELPDELRGRIDVFVMDLSRPS